jgi:hypothetical protein
MTTYRKLTIAELYPNSYGQDLLKKQSEHFMNKIITNGNFESGYENMPNDFPQASSNIPLIIDTKPPQYFVVNYLKNNWKPLLAVGIIVAVSATIYHKLNRKKEKKLDRNQIPKNLYYNLPKISI